MRPDAVRSAALLREARLRSGLSQVALAERSGKDRVQINRYEAAVVAPSLDVLLELVRACGFELSLDLLPQEDGDDAELVELLRLSPERRLERMLREAELASAADPVTLLAALERERVDHVVIGGLAEVLRGVDRVTDSVDVCPSAAARNLQRLGSAVAELGGGWELNGPDLPEPVYEVQTPSGALRVVVSPAGVPNGYVELRRQATREDLGHGVRPLVASTADLAAMAAARDPGEGDRARVRTLRRLLELETQPVAAGPAAAPAAGLRPALRSQARSGPRLGR